LEGAAQAISALVASRSNALLRCDREFSRAAYNAQKLRFTSRFIPTW
jgi:hypothetical protein